ncbi:MAG: nucleoside monophosphate kinase [Verrucomicrobia bacterium]|nr:nucleoside monophosphate kinase [Verrucomicrobiota bacterium]
MKFKTILIFGAPGSGKGTQGKILGQVPGYFHCACGDVFRSLDLKSDLGKVFLQYSSKGELVPDEFTVRLWQNAIEGMVHTRRFDPSRDILILDGIPRNLQQAQIMTHHLEVKKLFHLSCPDRSKLVERLKRRALKDNRLDDANEDTIRHRLEVYEKESHPILDYYGKDMIVHIDATLLPVKVLGAILAAL